MAMDHTPGSIILKERKPRRMMGLKGQLVPKTKCLKPPTVLLREPRGEPPKGVHDVRPLYGPLPQSLYDMLGKKTHSGSYPWRATCSRCLKEAAGTTDWVKLVRQAYKLLPVKDPEGNLKWVDDPAAQDYERKKGGREFTEIQ
eukprot:2175815-Heterocapsa_arctica.AAC.1